MKLFDSEMNNFYYSRIRSCSSQLREPTRNKMWDTLTEE